MASIDDVLEGRYRLIRLLGQGGMSDVYEAVDEPNNTAVAVKILRSADPAMAQRMAREAHALSPLVHPGLVRLLDTGLVGGQAFLVLELVEGTTLAHALRQGPLLPERTADLGRELAQALAYIHGQGIVHRDVKPSNILVGADGRAKLGDFGIARVDDASTLTMVGTTIGTAAYMAPEQLEDHRVAPSADVWSLGMVLLECLTGRRTYEGTLSEVAARRLAGPVPVPADLPLPWMLLLIGMLDHRPDRRLSAGDVAGLLAASPFRAEWTPSGATEAGHPTATAVLDLTALTPGSSTTALLEPDVTRVGPPPLPPPPPHVASRRPDRRWLVALGVLALAALVVGLVLGLGSNPPSRLGSATTTTTHPRTTTSTSTTSTTTTTVAGAPGALAALVGEVARGQSAGTVDPGSAQTITNQAQQAVSDASTGKSKQAAKDLQQAAMAITTGVQHGMITSAEGTTLQGDLSALAAALGVSLAGPGAAPGPGA